MQVPVDPGELGSSIDTSAITVWDAVWAVVIVAASFLIGARLRRLIGRFLTRFDGIPENYRLLIARATGWFIVGFGVVYALTVLGVDIGPAVIALLLLAALAFFAGRGLLENFAAGLVLQGSPMFGVGDQIDTIAGEGTVLEITGRTVIILAPSGARRSTITVGVAYGTDLDDARRVVRQAAESNGLVNAHPGVEALVTEFGDDAINIDCRFWHEPTMIGEKRAVDAVARAIYQARSTIAASRSPSRSGRCGGEGQGEEPDRG